MFVPHVICELKRAFSILGAAGGGIQSCNCVLATDTDLILKYCDKNLCTI